MIALVLVFTLTLLVLAGRRRALARRAAGDAPDTGPALVLSVDAPAWSRDPLTGLRDRMEF